LRSSGTTMRFFTPKFKRIESYCSWNGGYPLGILLEAQQIDDHKFLPGIQSGLQHCGRDLQRSKHPNHQYELCNFQDEDRSALLLEHVISKDLRQHELGHPQWNSLVSSNGANRSRVSTEANKMPG
jgi:hypothetical protein